MDVMTVGIITLGLSSGFGAGVYLIIAVSSWRGGHRWLGFWYANLGVAYIVVTVILAGRVLDYFAHLPRGFSLILLAPIVAIPPGIHLAGLIKARRLVREARKPRG